MKTQYYAASSLDGFIADPQDSLDWLFQFGAIAMGSATYEWILRRHVRIDQEKRGSWLYQQPAWVFTSRSLPTVPDAEIQFVSGDVRPVHQQMAEAASGKNLWILGGGKLVGQFYDHGLLDEMIVQVASVTLGGGSPLLPRAITTPPLPLVSVTAYGDAFAELRYDVPRPDEHEREAEALL